MVPEGASQLSHLTTFEHRSPIDPTSIEVSKGITIKSETACPSHLIIIFFNTIPKIGYTLFRGFSPVILLRGFWHWSFSSVCFINAAQVTLLLLQKNRFTN